MKWMESSNAPLTAHNERRNGSAEAAGNSTATAGVSSLNGNSGVERSSISTISAGDLFPFSPASIYSPGSNRFLDSAFARFLSQQNAYGLGNSPSFMCGPGFAIRDGMENMTYNSSLEQQPSSLQNQFAASAIIKQEAMSKVNPLYNPISHLENMNVKYSM